MSKEQTFGVRQLYVIHIGFNNIWENVGKMQSRRYMFTAWVVRWSDVRFFGIFMDPNSYIYNKSLYIKTNIYCVYSCMNKYRPYGKERVKKRDTSFHIYYIYKLDLFVWRYCLLILLPTALATRNTSPWVENVTAALCCLEISSPNFSTASLAVQLEWICWFHQRESWQESECSGFGIRKPPFFSGPWLAAPCSWGKRKAECSLQSSVCMGVKILFAFTIYFCFQCYNEF